MFGPKKLDIYEDNNNLTITYKWFTPGVLFLLLFSLIWNAFLLVWIGAAIAGGAPIMILFSVLHVAVGLGMGYTSLCGLLNKTIIDISYDQLNIVHRPIPWWKGNTKLSTTEIDQLYVKESKKNSKNGTASYSYELRAKLKNGEDKNLLSIGSTDSAQIQQIEERLEQFIGINDYPVKGEYGAKSIAGTALPAANKPRRRRKTDIGEHPQYDLEEGDSLAVNNKHLLVNHITQLDWKTGDTDKSFQLLSQNNKENLLYVKRKKGLFSIAVESEIPLFEVQKLGFETNNPPVAFQLEDKQYLKNSFQEGVAFRGDLGEGIPTKQWIYIETLSGDYIRIIDNDSMLSYYKGKQLPDNYFSNPAFDDLELKELDEEMEIRERNIWDDEFE